MLKILFCTISGAAYNQRLQLSNVHNEVEVWVWDVPPMVWGKYFNMDFRQWRDAVAWALTRAVADEFYIVGEDRATRFCLQTLE